MRKLMHILPFMDSEELKELAIKVMNEEIKGVKLMMLFPFLRRNDLSEIVDMLIEKKQGRELRHVIPFVSKEKLNQIYQLVKEGKISSLLLDRVSKQYISEEDYIESFNKYFKEMRSNSDA